MSDDAAYVEGDRDREKGVEGERSDKGSKPKTPSAKAKDLSHVPCKFFRVGGCTAGPSCPFSHVILEPGQHKEICTWFVKGNCKFGHKCALAHILPGQSMAMDRKNKKAAQTSAAAGSEKGKSGTKGVKKDTNAASAGNKLPLLTGGSTAPTRILNSTSSGSSKSGRPPINMPLKATISPSAPAPALKDTDFASFATLDDLEGLQRPQTNTSQNDDESLSPVSSKKSNSPVEPSKPPPIMPSITEPVPLPPSAPRSSATANANDFGPIGSPPNYRSAQLNGTTLSPATSPRNFSNFPNLGSSPSNNLPLSVAGTQDPFASSSYTMRGTGIAASLGSGMAMMAGRRGYDNPVSDVGPNSFSGLLSMQLSSSVSQGSAVNGYAGGATRAEYDISVEYDNFSGIKRKPSKGGDTAVEDEELGDFLPSSLNDLLTPEERSRRMSRSSSGAKPPGFSHLTNALASANQGSAKNGLRPSAGPADALPTGNGNATLGHRYSRSVPAPTLLGDIKSIWADTSVHPMPSSPHRGEIPSTTFSSALRNNNIHPDEVGLSMSIGSGGGTPSSLGMISPSNASAAFLPGLHRHYLDAKAKQAQQAQLGHAGIGRGLRGTSNPLFPNNGTTSTSSLAGGYLQPLGNVGLPSSVSNPSGLHTHIHGNTATTYRTTPSPFDLTQKLHQPQPLNARPISNLSSQAAATLDDPLLAPPAVLSPSSRALRSHAPGQSLPQGLAAGYSRIHALPPLTSSTSGSFVAGSSPGAAAVLGNGEGLGEWPTTTTSVQAPSNMVGVAGGYMQSNHHNAGLDSMFSRLNYSMAAPTAHGAPAVPPGLSRNISGGRYQQGPVGPLSPLSGPVVIRDDDILFDMDK